ncbi:MAG: RsmE family RNA methyltransferase [Actinomycetota bacterium]
MSDFALRRHAAAHVVLDADSTGLAGVRIAGDGVVAVDDAVEHHLRRVLRLGDGDLVTVTDGAGRWVPTRVSGTGSDLLVVDGEVRNEVRTRPVFTVAAALPKGDRLEWMVQKVTECGADRLVLLDCDRSVVRWKPERAERQLERLRRIADEAARQSRRVWRLELVPPTPAAEVLPDAAVAEPGGEPLLDALGDSHSIVAIGPEGGWSDDESAAISHRIDLGPNILRTETAAIVATALCVVRNH